MTTLREAYDLIDRFLRNSLCDDDYADYSEALELLSSEPPRREWLGLTHEERDDICKDFVGDDDRVGAYRSLALEVEVRLAEKNRG